MAVMAAASLRMVVMAVQVVMDVKMAAPAERAALREIRHL